MELMEWLKQTWLYIVAIVGAFGVLGSLKKNIKELNASIKKPFDDQNKRIQLLEENLLKMSEINEEHFDTLNKFVSKELELETKMDNVSTGMIALLRDKINGYYFDKCNERGFITPAELEIVTALFDSYHKLGGNGLIAREMEIINKFPVFEDEESYKKYMERKNKKASD